VGKRFGFKEWFREHGERLWRGWLRAREDGNEEEFTGWVLGEYDCYVRDRGKKDGYEVPYRLNAASDVEQFMMMEEEKEG